MDLRNGKFFNYLMELSKQLESDRQNGLEQAVWSHASAQLREESQMDQIRCQSCSSRQTKLIFDFGLQSNPEKLLPNQEAKPELTPTRLFQCESCGLAQLEHRTPQSFIPFPMSLSPDYLQDQTRWASTLRLPFRASILHLGSNDGYLLQILKRQGFTNLLGMEHSPILREISQIESPTITTLTPSLLHAFDLIIMHNVLHRTPNPKDYLETAKKYLKATGFISIEVPDASSGYPLLSPDAIHQANQTYFCPATLQTMALNTGLSLSHFERIPSQGGSIRARLRTGTHSSPDIPLKPKSFQGLSRTIQSEFFQIQQFVNQVKLKGQKLAIFGASSKGITAINMAGLRHTKDFELLADDDSHKIGKLIPRTHQPPVPIHDISAIESLNPDYVWITSWNRFEENAAKLKQFTKAKLITKGNLFA